MAVLGVVACGGNGYRVIEISQRLSGGAAEGKS